MRAEKNTKKFITRKNLSRGKDYDYDYNYDYDYDNDYYRYHHCIELHSYTYFEVRRECSGKSLYCLRWFTMWIESWWDKLLQRVTPLSSHNKNRQQNVQTLLKQTKKTTQFWVLYNPNAHGHLREVVAYESWTAGVFYGEKFGYRYLVKRMYCEQFLFGYNTYY